MIKDLRLKIHPLFRYWIICLFAYLLICLFPSKTGADNMTNGSYTLYETNLNMAAGKGTNSSYKALSTTGQTGPGLYSGGNRKIRAGFEYILSIIPFAFSVDSVNINFGTITATNPVTRTSTLTISNNSAFGYSITAYENHQLSNPASGAIIPDTTCDNGTCTESVASTWTSNLTYGFGYRCDNVVGTDCAFITANAYKQFANNNIGETPQAVMTGLNTANGNKSTITYKINVSGTQAAGLYTNTITYVATGTY